MNRKLISTLSIIALLFCGCKGDGIGDPQIGTLEFHTYTADTLRFRVLLNGEVLSDSLMAPRGSVTKLVSFYKNTGRLQIVDAENKNFIVLDTVINMRIGISKFSVVQTQPGEVPALPPLPNEPYPAAGNFKVRFLYEKPTSTAVNFAEPIRIIVRKDDVPIDTVEVSRYGTTPYYEGKANTTSFKVALQYPNGDPISSTALNSRSFQGDYAGFNTAAVFGTGTTSNPTVFTYRLEFAYSRE